MNTIKTFDALVEASRKISELARISELKREADQTDRKECGNCTKWMKSNSCPREYHVNGRRRGPSMSAPACEKFDLESCVIALKAKRMTEIEHRLALAIEPDGDGSER